MPRPRYIGLGVGKFGAGGSDLTSATVTGNVVVRCGGDAYVQRQPALMIGNGGSCDSHTTPHWDAPLEGTAFLCLIVSVPSTQ
jgi:hypothetical protein